MKSFFFTLCLVCLSSGITSAFAETYYAKVENGIITNVIVADKGFIDTQPGTWIQTFKDNPNTQYAGIGYAYNQTDKKIIPLENPDRIFHNMKTNWTGFVSMLSSGLENFYHPKPLNITAINSTGIQ